MTVRVLWVIKGLGPGGAEHLLAAAAESHDRSRFHIECAYVLPWKDHLVARLEAAGVRCHCMSRTRTDRRWPWRLRRLVRGGEWDVVHVHSPMPGSVARLAARTMRSADRPGLVSTEHNRWETHRLPTRLVNRLTSRWDTEAIAVTDEVRESMKGPVATRAVAVRHGIDTATVGAARAERSAARDELGIGADEVVVGTVANFRPQKDYPNLLRAARVLADREVSLRILAVGQGPQEDEIRQLHRELELGDRVILTGVRDDAARLMGACDAFTMASQWEGLPVAVMEACALGLPIVATQVGGIAEEFTHEADALLVPPRDATALADGLERIAADTALRERLGTASLARAPEFDIARTVQVLEATYQRAARSPRAVSEPPAAEPATKPAARPRAEPLEIRPAVDEDREAVLALLRRSLGSDDDPRYDALFAWKHDENVFGRSPMWVAVDGDRIAAFRTLMRWEFVRGGQVLRAVRAVDTATDPDYQGRGLFTALTRHGLAEVLDEGIDFVFNTPNSQSRPGYLKMGWREVGDLPAAVRFVGPSGALRSLRSRVPADRWSQALDVGEHVTSWLDGGGASPWISAALDAAVDVRQIRTNVDEAFVRWRFATPLLGYRVVDDGESAIIVRARRRGAATELAVVAAFGDPARCDRQAAAVAKQAGTDYAIRLGAPRPQQSFVPLPGGGPMLTWRAVNDAGMPPLSNWALTLGDIELF